MVVRPPPESHCFLGGDSFWPPGLPCPAPVPAHLSLWPGVASSLPLLSRTLDPEAWAPPATSAGKQLRRTPLPHSWTSVKPPSAPSNLAGDTGSVNHTGFRSQSQLLLLVSSQPCLFPPPWPALLTPSFFPSPWLWPPQGLPAYALTCAVD